MMMPAKKASARPYDRADGRPRTSVLAQDLTGRWKGGMEPTNLSAEIELEIQRHRSASPGDT